MAAAGVLQGREPVEARGHEVADPADAVGVAAMRDVHDDEAARHHAIRGALGEHRRHASEGRADQHGRSAEAVNHGQAIRRVRGERIVAVQRPLAVAVAAQVEGHGPPSLPRERLRRASPRMPGLAASVHEQHGPVLVVAPDVGDEMDPLEPVESNQPWIHRPTLSRGDRRLTRRSSAFYAAGGNEPPLDPEDGP